MRNPAVDATPQAPAEAGSPGDFASLPGDGGTLLAVVPVNGGSSRLAIVGYLLPVAREHASAPVDQSSAVRPPADGLVVDAAGYRVLASGHDVGPLFREFELLAFLAANPDRAFPRAHLLARVWGAAYRGTTRTVDVHIHRLRRKLGPGYAQRLVTVRGVGYMYRTAC